ncbi:uncharacterized protein LOC124543428 [Vanessa cardui]|uniref:uncharacterized protein LOC124543428 n=1 Tax=Vanessa cardui TaxID=171605 RepID=UPI001F12C045|nr:uncharacterized protein LOC124543428 [Vanessa cardui]
MAMPNLQIEKLAGRDNYFTWKFAVMSYLQLEELWECIEPGTDVDLKKDVKATSKIILLVEPMNYVHIENAKTAKEVWENLQNVFEDSGLSRKVGLLKDLINTSLDICGSIAFSAYSTLNQDDWYIDSGATMHMTRRSDWMYDEQSPPVHRIKVANSEAIPVQSMGKVNIQTKLNKDEHRIQVRNVLFIPKLTTNLLSISQLTKSGCKVEFTNTGCNIYNGNKNLVATARLMDNMFKLNVVSGNAYAVTDLTTWHKRMDHLNMADVKRLPFCTEASGIKHQTSTPYTPEQNGVAERMNRTLVERAKCMLFEAKLQKSFWAEAVATAAYIINRSPSRVLAETTPYEKWTGKKPNISHLKIFGSKAMVHVPKQNRRKWDTKSRELIFVGYCENSKGYRLYGKDTRNIVISRDVIFIENSENYLENNAPKTVSVPQPITLPLSSTDVGCIDSHNQAEDTDVNESSQNEILTSNENSFDSSMFNRQTDETYYPDTDDYDDCHDEYIQNRYSLRSGRKNVEGNNFMGFMEIPITPKDLITVEDALSGPNAKQWKEAMDEEYKSLIENNTWEITTLPSDKRAIPCKWVYKVKRNENGETVKYKARLVIKGCSQRPGIDYTESFSPVVRLTSLRYLLALAAKYDLDICQMDAVSAFLQGDVEEEIYMKQPPLDNGIRSLILR